MSTSEPTYGRLVLIVQFQITVCMGFGRLRFKPMRGIG